MIFAGLSLWVSTAGLGRLGFGIWEFGYIILDTALSDANFVHIVPKPACASQSLSEGMDAGKLLLTARLWVQRGFLKAALDPGSLPFESPKLFKTLVLIFQSAKEGVWN